MSGLSISDEDDDMDISVVIVKQYCDDAEINSHRCEETESQFPLEHPRTIQVESDSLSSQGALMGFPPLPPQVGQLTTEPEAFPVVEEFTPLSPRLADQPNTQLHRDSMPTESGHPGLVSRPNTQLEFLGSAEPHTTQGTAFDTDNQHADSCVVEVMDSVHPSELIEGIFATAELIAYQHGRRMDAASASSTATIAEKNETEILIEARVLETVVERGYARKQEQPLCGWLVPSGAATVLGANFIDEHRSTTQLVSASSLEQIGSEGALVGFSLPPPPRAGQGRQRLIITVDSDSNGNWLQPTFEEFYIADRMQPASEGQARSSPPQREQPAREQQRRRHDQRGTQPSKEPKTIRKLAKSIREKLGIFWARGRRVPKQGASREVSKSTTIKGLLAM